MRAGESFQRMPRRRRTRAKGPPGKAKGPRPAPPSAAPRKASKAASGNWSSWEVSHEKWAMKARRWRSPR
eukprot:8347438-Alexandrium_andersonii.AAC.1